MRLRRFLERRTVRRRHVEENEGTFRSDPFEDAGGIYSGTVGWGDGGQHYDILPNGRTLVRVTLHEGRNPREDVPDDGLAHGIQILARVGAPLFAIPDPGTEVMVAMPAGGWWLPGTAVIFTAVEPTPDHQFNPNSIKMNFPESKRLVIKAGEIVLTDYEDRYVSVGPLGGIKMGDASGSSMYLFDGQLMLAVAVDGDVKCNLELAPGKLRASCKSDAGVGSISLDKATFACVADLFAAQTGSCKLGANATPVTPVVVGTTGQTGVGSTSIYGQP